MFKSLTFYNPPNTDKTTNKFWPCSKSTALHSSQYNVSAVSLRRQRRDCACSLFHYSKTHAAERNEHLYLRRTGKRPPVSRVHPPGMFLLPKILKCEDTYLKNQRNRPLISILNTYYYFFTLVFHINKPWFSYAKQTLFLLWVTTYFSMKALFLLFTTTYSSRKQFLYQFTVTVGQKYKSEIPGSNGMQTIRLCEKKEKKLSTVHREFVQSRDSVSQLRTTSLVSLCSVERTQHK